MVVRRRAVGIMSATNTEEPMSDLTIDQILDALDRSHQRATYGAVAAVLDRAPRTLMKGRERDQRHSWIVSRATGEPTGYQPAQVHPSLKERTEVIGSKDELAQWLQAVQ
jgi:hypothetical protein